MVPIGVDETPKNRARRSNRGLQLVTGDGLREGFLGGNRSEGQRQSLGCQVSINGVGGRSRGGGDSSVGPRDFGSADSVWG